MPTLRPMQEEDVTKLISCGLRAIVANAPGTGKTAIAITAIAKCYRQRTPALVIAPASVTRNWIKEFQTWGQGLRVTLFESQGQLPEEISTLDVVVISWALLEPRIDVLASYEWKCIVADEAHFAKNPHAERSKALEALCARDRGLLLLTGTPIVNTIGEMEQLMSLFQGSRPPVLRRLLSEVAPDIPEKKRSYLNINLPAQFRRDYDKAEQDFEGWLRETTKGLTEEGFSESEIQQKISQEALVKIGYLRRILGEGKIRAAADFAARTVRAGEPLVIFCEHQVVVQGLVAALRKQRLRNALIDGSTPTKKRQEYIEGFQKHSIPIIICTKAGKEGITLHAARHLMFVERYYTSADEDQAEDRIRRIGQTFATTIWLLHVPGTVDDRIDDIVKIKRKLIEKHIGNELIVENEEENVKTMIAQWTKHSKGSLPEVNTNLGICAPLPPLPSPRETYAVLFDKAHWNLKGAYRWSVMNGYLVNKLLPSSKLKLRLNPEVIFKPGTFKIQSVSKHISVITGERVSRDKEKSFRRDIDGRPKKTPLDQSKY